MLARLLLLSLALCMLIGCSPADSINPLFTGDDVISFDQYLPGTWHDQNSSPQEYLLFKEGADYRYRITVAGQDGTKQEFNGRLGYIHNQRFLDVTPVSATAEWSALSDADLTINRQPPNTTVFRSATVKLGDLVYLQFTDAGSDANQTHFKVKLRTAHWFCKFATDDSVMHLDCLENDWLGQHIADGSLHLDHASVTSDGSGLVITASTTDLQRFVTEHAQDKEAWAWSMTATHTRQ